MDREQMEEYPAIADLAESAIAILRGVTFDSLAAEVVEVFEDDHEPCVAVELNGIKVSFWWLSPESAAAFHYLDSPTARRVVLEMIATGVKEWEDDQAEDHDEK